MDYAAILGWIIIVLLTPCLAQGSFMLECLNYPFCLKERWCFIVVDSLWDLELMYLLCARSPVSEEKIVQKHEIL